jgi:UDP-3-O-[3-hydroxymyristoyl] glucosamine N-acyltransferase
MKFTVDQIAQLISGTVEGNGSAFISKFDKIEEGSKESISFLANPKYESFLYDSDATAVIISTDLQLKSKPKATLIRVADPYLAFTILLQKYQEFTAKSPTGISKLSQIDESCQLGSSIFIDSFVKIGQHSIIGEHAQIASNVSIGNHVKIGKNCKIYSGVVLYDGIEIGNDCTIHSNAVIGSDGFGFAPQADGTYTGIPQIGNVILGNKVSIGANTTIDRATMGSTKIGHGVKIDNLVQIAHNVEIGDHTVIAAQAGISGSTKIGKYCMIGGQVGMAGHINIADKTIVTAKSGVTKSFKTSGLILGGNPATLNHEFLKSNAFIRRLPEILSKVSQLEKQED